MATVDDLLKKAASRKKGSKPFVPEKRRAWDYAIDTPQKSSEEKKNEAKKNRNISRNDTGEQKESEIGTTGNKNRNNWEQKEEQSSIKIRDEIGNKNYPSSVNESNVSEQPKQTNKKGEQEDQILKCLRKTTGHQLQIMAVLTSHIKSKKEIENLVDIPVSALAKRINADKGTTRTSIKRLQKKNILLKSKGERGRHGCTQVVIPNFIIKECLNLFQCSPYPLDESENIINNENRNTIDVYSSSNIINITTNSEINRNNLPDEWVNINIESLKEIGFSITQLKQLHSKNLNTPETIQESINHFAYGLENNPKVKNYPEPLNVLMGVLRKGQAWTEPNYQAPQEIAQRQLIERKKAERERLKKLEDDAYKLALDEWQETLTTEKLEEIAPPKKGRGDLMPHHVKLSMFFRENVWPEKKKDYLIG